MVGVHAIPAAMGILLRSGFSELYLVCRTCRGYQARQPRFTPGSLAGFFMRRRLFAKNVVQSGARRLALRLSHAASWRLNESPTAGIFLALVIGITNPCMPRGESPPLHNRFARRGPFRRAKLIYSVWGGGLFRFKIMFRSKSVAAAFRVSLETNPGFFPDPPRHVVLKAL